MKLRIVLNCTAGVVLLGLLACVASADTIEFRDGVDGYDQLMRQIGVDANHSSSSETSAVGVAGTDLPLRSISSFDISAIPAGATIESVTFQFKAGGIEGSFNKAIELHKITKTDTIEVGASGAPTNWTNITTTVPWTTPGGDYDGTAMSSIDPGSYSTGASYTFDSSAAFVASAQDALDGDISLQFILRSAAQEGDNSRAFIRVNSDQKEWQSHRPLLTVTYYPGDAIPGDANRDNSVDSLDAAVLAAHWLSTTDIGWSSGDFNDDGIVDDIDATIMAANWGATTLAAAVPEPSMIALLLTMVGAVLVWRRVR